MRRGLRARNRSRRGTQRRLSRGHAALPGACATHTIRCERILSATHSSLFQLPPCTPCHDSLIPLPAASSHRVLPLHPLLSLFTSLPPSLSPSPSLFSPYFYAPLPHPQLASRDTHSLGASILAPHGGVELSRHSAIVIVAGVSLIGALLCGCRCGARVKPMARRAFACIRRGAASRAQSRRGGDGCATGSLTAQGLGSSTACGTSGTELDAWSSPNDAAKEAGADAFAAERSG